MTKQNKEYFMPLHVLRMLQRKGIDHCVSCEEKIMEGEQVSSRRSGNHLRIRCMPCTERYHLV